MTKITEIAELPFEESQKTMPVDPAPAVVVTCDRCGEKIGGDSDADAADRLDYHRGGHMMLFRDLDDIMDRLGALEAKVAQLLPDLT
jgi:hypothetical protein